MIDFFARLSRSFAGDAGFFLLLIAGCVFLAYSKYRERGVQAIAVLAGFFCLFVTSGAADLLSKPLLAISARHQRQALTHWKEDRAKPKSKAKVSARAALKNCLARVRNMVVLGGGMESDFVPGTATYLRVLRALRAQRDFIQRASPGPLKNIFFSGGATAPPSTASEAEIMQFLYLALEHELAKSLPEQARLPRKAQAFSGAVPKNVNLFIEDQSMTTYENALYTRAKFSQLKETPEIVLVTGSVHMLRAMLTFEKQGFRVCALEAPDKNTATRNFFSFAQAAHVVTVLHEYVGLVTYRLAGRL